MSIAFRISGQVAAIDFNVNPNVKKSSNKFADLMDYEKLDYFKKYIDITKNLYMKHLLLATTRRGEISKNRYLIRK